MLSKALNEPKKSRGSFCHKDFCGKFAKFSQNLIFPKFKISKFEARFLVLENLSFRFKILKIRQILSLEFCSEIWKIFILIVLYQI